MMTIDEAIKHCLEVAEHNEYLHKRGYAGGCNSHDCLESAIIHRQLAEWLIEYKEAKILLKSAIDNAQRVDVNGDIYYDWMGADEALKLIGDEYSEH